MGNCDTKTAAVSDQDENGVVEDVVKFYWHPISPPARAVLYILKALNL